MLYQESVSLYHYIWGSYFENSTRLDMYTIFSMKKFKKEVKSLNETTNFGAQQEKDLINQFCNEVTFEAEYPEAKGETFTSAPIGDEYNLIDELKAYKRHVFRNYCGNNPKTGQDCTSKDVIIDLLMKEDLL